ncbi:WD40-repeat-containing domain protein [Protomyces lactucae-debilis]|uniref:ASTRA-associated protein 1 n=1 Tax=Protomyces lactucae-debilis TaxID=2754530 RepID=A0A1Y2FXG4_PROLT|nr:WD40-repeat-containing domain protein [Protomyces lactucae-debilis]ORY87876.1 WD40-repeat-containing domain protein [Protomyces lactucae-debilis]
MTSSNLLQDDQPPVPFFVLRGHHATIQCLCFHEDTLFSGDAHGFVIRWSLTTCRPLAIWRAHKDALLTVACYKNRIVTHGRDNKLLIWEILNDDQMSTRLPLSTTEARLLKPGQVDPCTRAKPFLQASLDVNALNFCQMSITPSIPRGSSASSSSSHAPGIMIAVPGLLGSEYIDVFEMPSTHRLITRIAPTSPFPSSQTAPTPVSTPGLKKGAGTVMCLDLQYPYLAAGYESGLVVLYLLNVSRVDPKAQRQDGQWGEVHRWQIHHDAVLGCQLCVQEDGVTLFSSGIDALIARYHVPASILDSSMQALGDTHTQDPQSDKITEIYDDSETQGIRVAVRDTKHAGQQSLCLRNDGLFLATAGWDGRGRVYAIPKSTESLRTVQQVAVLKWHREGAVQSVAFAEKGEETGLLALGGKDGKISLWQLF